MDRDLLTTTMKASISEVLEKMFFLPLDVSDASAPADLWKDRAPADPITAGLEFSGPFKGRFALLIPGRLAGELAADFMGVDREGVPREQVEQTVKEILNMIAGSTFSALDENAVFQLGIPESLPPGSVFPPAEASENEVFLGVETLKERIGLLLVET
jgi:CheY-specific phosphatase CheX